jgi:hypothetical protein
MNLTNEDIVGSLIPNVYVSRIILESTPDDKLKTNIQFVLKEHYGNDDISSWLEDSEVLRNLNIFVIQSTDPVLTELIQNLVEAAQLQAEGTDSLSLSIKFMERLFDNNQINVNQSDLLAIFRSALYSENSFNNFKAVLSLLVPNADKNLTYKEIKLFTSLSPSIKDLLKEGKAELVEEDDGTRSYNIFVDLSFGLDNEQNIPNENVQNLSYLFGSYISLLNILSSIDNLTDQPVDFFTLGVTDIRVEEVISSGEIVSNTYVFVDNRDLIWPGKVHTILRVNSQNEQSVIYRSGESENQNSVDLRRIEIPNNKIQDFRQLRNIKEMQKLDTKFLQDSVLDLLDDPSLSYINFTEDTSAVSDCYVSVDERNNSSVSFFIDFKKMFLKNSVHGYALSKKNSANAKNFIQSFYRACDIQRIALKCKRVDLDDSLSAYKNNEEIVSEYFNTNDANSISLIEKKINLDLIPEDRAEQLRMFSIVDRGTPKNIGVYEYSVEIDYKDNIPATLNKLLGELREEYRCFLEYYNFCLSPKIFNQKIQRFYKDALSNYAYVSEILQRSYGIEQITNFSISGRIYLNVLEQIYNIPVNSIKDTVTQWLSPYNGTPTSISYVLQMYEDLINEFEKVLQKTPFVNNSLNEKGEAPANNDYINVHTKPEEQESNQRDSSKTITIVKNFSNKLDLTVPYRYEYLNMNRRETTQNPNTDPFLHEIIKTQLIERKLKPIAHHEYIKDSNSYKQDFNKKISLLFSEFTNLKITKHFDYLITNSDVKIDNKVTRMPISIDAFVNPALLEQISQNSGRNQEVIDDLQQVEALNKVLLTLFTPTVSNNSNTAKFNIDISNKDNIFWNIRPKSATVVNGSMVEGLFYGCRFNKNLIKDLPNQIKSLIKSRISAENNVISDAQVRFKYEMLKKIVYLRSFQYDLSTKTFDLNQETWAPLKNLDNIFGNNNFVFCRLIDYVQDNIKYKFNKALKTDVVNEFFLLNKVNLNNNGFVTNGATHITTQLYENRCVSETKMFFNDEEQPPVQIVLNGTTLNNDDSFVNSKYSFLSPLGFYMDGLFKTLVPQGLVSLTLLQPVFQETQNTETSTIHVYEKFSLINKQFPTNLYTNRFRTLNGSIYSSNDKRKGRK